MSDPQEHSREDNDKPVDKPEVDKPGPAFSFSDIWQQIPRVKIDLKAEKNDPETPSIVTVLGQQYAQEGEFHKQILSRIWLSYRTGFEPIPKNPEGPSPLSFIHSMVFNKNPLSTNVHSFIDNDNFTTDVGWGCMIRTSQALLANTYQRILLGSDFEYDETNPNELEVKLIDLFADDSAAPFALHNFIRVANELPLQVKPGQWFGPNAASLSIQRLCDYSNSLENNLLPTLKVLISETCDLYEDKVSEMLSQSPVLILLPIRLGIDKTNQFYFKSIFHLLSTSQSVGIAGGRPSSSLYFIGYEQEELLYLDPHYPQQCLGVAPAGQRYQTYHSQNYQRMNVTELDPSMMIGILVNDASDFEGFKASCVENDNKIVHFHATEGKPPESDDFIDIVDDFDVPEDMEALQDGSHSIT